MTAQDYKDYQKLAEKLAWKYSQKCNLGFEDLYSIALEGMVSAFNNYDGSSRKSGYISTIMVKHILIGIQDESRTVRIPYSRFTKDQKEGVVSSSSVGLAGYDDYDEDETHNIEPILDYIKTLPERDRDIVLSFYGIEEKLSGTELAKKYNISSSMVTYILKKVLKDIRNRFDIEDLIA